MKNLRKIFPIAICSFLVGGGAFVMAKGLHKDVTNFAKADTDHGAISLAFSHVDDRPYNGFYLKASEANDLPYTSNWSLSYFPVNNAGGLFINDVDVGKGVLKKFGNGLTDYYVALADASHAQSLETAGTVVTIKGDWYCEVEGERHTFSFANPVTKTWGGAAWVDKSIEDYDLEDYETVSLLDCGIADVNAQPVSTEIAFNDGNLYKNGFALNNSTGSWAFTFKFEALDDEMAGALDIRIGSNGAWVDGHFIQIAINNTWHTNGAMLVRESLGNNVLHASGDIPLNFKSGAEHLIEVGIIKIKNTENSYLEYVKYDGGLASLNVWEITEPTQRTTRVGMYNNGDDIKVGNVIPQTIGTEKLIYDNTDAAGGMSFHTQNDINPAFNSWTKYLLPYVDSNVTLNGENFVAGKANYFKKTGTTSFYFGFGNDLSLTPHAGDLLTIGGEFKAVKDGVVYNMSLAFASFAFDGTKWNPCAIPELQDSSFDNLQPTDLLRNLGRMKPDHSGSAVKEFDQKITWDAENQQEVDTLVYKKDANGNTGIYFTNNNSETHGEFRVYLPDNGYKTETKGYALTKLTFDYILLDSGVEHAHPFNHSIDENGYFVPTTGNVTGKFTVQALCQHTHQDTTYFDREVEILNDGQLHSVTLNIPYADICGFAFEIWNFDGTFFMSNCHADFLDYDQALNEFVTESLKMYHYTGSNQCGEYYGAAKTAYAALTADEKVLFGTHAAYGSARARLTAWAAANGETFDASAGTFTPHASGLGIMNIANNNYAVIIIVASMIATISLTGMFLIIRRRKMIRK